MADEITKIVWKNILKIWELVSFWGVKTNFGKYPWNEAYEKIKFLQYGSLIVIVRTKWSLYGICMIFWSFSSENGNFLVTLCNENVLKYVCEWVVLKSLKTPLHNIKMVPYAFPFKWKWNIEVHKKEHVLMGVRHSRLILVKEYLKKSLQHILGNFMCIRERLRLFLQVGYETT